MAFAADLARRRKGDLQRATTAGQQSLNAETQRGKEASCRVATIAIRAGVNWVALASKRALLQGFGWLSFHQQCGHWVHLEVASLGLPVPRRPPSMVPRGNRSWVNF